MTASVTRAGFLQVGILCVLSCTSVALGADAPSPSLEEGLTGRILEAAKVDGGVIVHVNCGNGKLTAALRANDRFLVQGLDTDGERVAEARATIRGLGRYGPVAVDRFDGTRLPYAESMVNLIVIGGPSSLDREELLRVLAPGGVAVTVAADNGHQIEEKFVKPRPGNTDEWTHYLHDAGGNPVAHDELVGPPRYLRWTAEPPHARSHEHTPSINAVVSAGGRVFYIMDRTPVVSVRRAAEWQLVARDAYNGTLLWRRAIASWYPHILNWSGTPPQLQRKLVAVGDRVYATLGLYAPVSVLDAATGETLQVFENSEGTEEIVCHQGTLLVAVRGVSQDRKGELARLTGLMKQEDSPLFDRDSAEPFVQRFRDSERRGEVSIQAIDAQTGSLLWKKDGADTAGLRTLTLSALGDCVFYQRGKDVVCLERGSGRQVWSVAAAPMRLVWDGGVVCADGQACTVLSLKTGEPRWSQGTRLSEVRDAFVASGSLWVGGFKPFPAKRGPSWGPYFVTQFDPATGEVLRHIEPENPSHHHRCYSNKATDRYILGGRRGTEFIDLQTGEVLWNSWARGVCRYGVMPANGLLYVPPHACGCYTAAKLIGFNALAAEKGGGKSQEVEESKSEKVEESKSERVEESKSSDRLDKGPAYAVIPDPSTLIPHPSSVWPTYRHDSQRSGCTSSPVPSALRVKWVADIGGRLTAPTVADGKVLVAAVDEHDVCAVDAESGKPAWRFTAGSRVDSPPTVYQGHAIFGCRDGYVYKVRMADGQWAWRLQAAREDRRIAANGQIESVSPVHGSVLIQDGAACFTAGRSSYLDGGIDLCRVDPETGATLSRTPIYSPDPQTGRQPPQAGPAFMPGSRADILSADDSHLYLQDSVFSREGKVQAEGKAHLFALTGFLDDTWPHRSYWIFGTQVSLATGCSGRDKNLIYGRLLVFDGSTIYGYGRAGVHWSNQLQDGPYRLFAQRREDGTRPWDKRLAIQVRAMLLAGKVLFVAGPNAELTGWGEGRGAKLLAISAADGAELGQADLDCPPLFDGMAAAYGRLYLALEDGRLACLAAE